MIELNKTTRTPLTADLVMETTVSYCDETQYESIERSFNVIIQDADGIEETDTTKIILQYDGRYAAVTWETAPSDEQVNEVGKFIFGDKCYVECIVQLKQKFAVVDIFGIVHTVECMVAEEMEESVLESRHSNNSEIKETLARLEEDINNLLS